MGMLKRQIVLVLLCLSIVHLLIANAFAQSVPLPAPSRSGSTIFSEISKIFGTAPSTMEQSASQTAPIDKTKPMIRVITKELFEGKNVVKVEITDDSPISARYVKHVSNGYVVYDDLVKSSQNEYSTLIDAKAPTAVVVFEAVDQYGNKAIEEKTFDVKPAGSWFDSVARWLQNLVGPN